MKPGQRVIYEHEGQKRQAMVIKIVPGEGIFLCVFLDLQGLDFKETLKGLAKYVGPVKRHEIFG